MNSFFEYIIKYINLIRISDLIDIAIVTVIIYYLIKLLRETRAMQLVKGLMILFVVFVASDWLRLNTLHYLLSSAMQIGMFAVIVIFQPELRSMLERVGRFKVGSFIDINQGKRQRTNEYGHRIGRKGGVRYVADQNRSAYCV